MRLALLASPVLLLGCAVGPDYHRPDLSPPASFRGDEQPSASSSFATTQWRMVYTDPKLQDLIALALQGNLDLKTAMARIDEARANLSVSRMAYVPTIDAAGSLSRGRTSVDARPPGAPAISNVEQVTVAASYELDLWGRVRRSTESARATLLATEFAERTVITVLIANVANAYFNLQSLDAQLEITRRTVDSREKFVALTGAQHDRGYATGLDVATAEAQAAAARALVPDLQRRITQTEDQLCVLLGQNAHAIERTNLGELMPEIPPLPAAGLPSQLLEQRPDVRAAEESLRAANADVGVAKAALFPTISLTGSAGSLSSPLGMLFRSPQAAWGVAVNAVQPLLDSQRSVFQIEAADARKREALDGYELAVRTAFQEVADALVAYARYGESARELSKQVEALQRADQIALSRYRVGYASYFDVINADRDLFTAELTLNQEYTNGLMAYVQLYQALGGGW
jgi:outer membrane protein, multidrug efflux system